MVNNSAMKISAFPFETVDWASIKSEPHPGTSGEARWKIFLMNDIRIRMVEYSPGYLADHWCNKGHIIFCISGEMITELEDGSEHVLSAGMSYQVGDDSNAHRTRSEDGCLLFIVD